MDKGSAGTRAAVLVVDDEEELRAMLELVLSSHGIRVEVAASGEEALALCDGHAPFDVIVLDHRMPRLTGAEVARRLREGGYPAPIILFSAYLDPALRAECESLGLVHVDKLDWPQLVDTCVQLAA